MRIVFVRHGEPDYEHDCLTPLGELQAEAAAERLREEGIGAIFTSPQGRARQTADAAAKALGLAPAVLDFMHELHWSSADGREIFAGGHPWKIADEMVRAGHDLMDANWREHPYYTGSSKRASTAGSPRSAMSGKGAITGTRGRTTGSLRSRSSATAAPPQRRWGIF